MKPSLLITTRTLLAILGGYAFSAATSAALAVALARLAGMDRSEAVLLAAMLAFVVYLVVLLWAFTAPRLGRVAVVLVGGALACQAVIRLLAPAADRLAGGV
jgi:hypothetical protein